MNTSPAAAQIASLLTGSGSATGAADAPEGASAFGEALAAAAASRFHGSTDEADDDLQPGGMPSAAALAFLASLAADESVAADTVQPGDGMAAAIASETGRSGTGAAQSWTNALLRGLAARTSAAAGEGGGAALHPGTRQDMPQAGGLAAMADALRLMSAGADHDAAAPLRAAPAIIDAEAAPLYGPQRESTLQPAGATNPLHAPLRQPVGSSGWADELGRRMVMMSLRGQQEGSLTLSPEHLGPLEVHISMRDESASVWFGAQHAETRAALAEALPRLRELFENSGLSLGHAGVSQDMPRQETQGAGESPRASGDPDLPGGAEQPVPVDRRIRAALLDAWA